MRTRAQIGSQEDLSYTSKKMLQWHWICLVCNSRPKEEKDRIRSKVLSAYLTSEDVKDIETPKNALVGSFRCLHTQQANLTVRWDTDCIFQTPKSALQSQSSGTSQEKTTLSNWSKLFAKDSALKNNFVSWPWSLKFRILTQVLRSKNNLLQCCLSAKRETT